MIIVSNSVSRTREILVTTPPRLLVILVRHYASMLIMMTVAVLPGNMTMTIVSESADLA